MVEMNRIGIVESEDKKNKVVNLIGYGDYIGDFKKDSTDFPGIEIDAPKIKMDNGKTIWLDEIEHSFFADETAIKTYIEKMKNEGYNIKVSP